ncbi:MAG: N-acetylneuraminate synthase family protein [Lachnospiraceae bacterium]|nr:N-acetylneuraminate synthase family protein [Lachnospiraceae bacterium]
MSKIIERLEQNQFTLIAEIGVNYYDIAAERGISPLDAARLMIREAAAAGVHAVKFQSYKAETLASKDSPAYWDRSEEPTDSQYKLFQKFDSFGEEEYGSLKACADECNVEFLSTAFDFASADYLDSMMEVYKISSSDLSNLPFIAYQARKEKPILLSVGASNLDEIHRAVDTIKQYNNKKITLLHCVLEYPTPYEDANLLKIASLKKEFPDCYIGYSDHTKPTEDCDVIKTAYNLGAVLVEKHFTLNKELKGNDHYHAMDPEDVKRILEGIDYLDLIRGRGDLKSLDTELQARKQARRSIVAACHIAKDTIIKEEMLTFKRPGTGISPADMGKILGSSARMDIAEDTVLSYEMIK